MKEMESNNIIPPNDVATTETALPLETKKTEGHMNRYFREREERLNKRKEEGTYPCRCLNGEHICERCPSRKSHLADDGIKQKSLHNKEK